MLPVTIVPRTVGAVGAALTTGGTAAAQGIAMLNPQRWGGTAPSGYSRNFENDQPAGVLFGIEEVEIQESEGGAGPIVQGELFHFTLFLKVDPSV